MSDKAFAVSLVISASDTLPRKTKKAVGKWLAGCPMGATQARRVWKARGELFRMGWAAPSVQRMRTPWGGRKDVA